MKYTNQGKNDFMTLEQFTSQYTGVWAPSENHWFGLDFSWHGDCYRLHTGTMFKEDRCLLPDGREVLFSLYKKQHEPQDGYQLIGQYASMEEMLDSQVIEGCLFARIIVDPETELLGQD